MTYLFNDELRVFYFGNKNIRYRFSDSLFQVTLLKWNALTAVQKKQKCGLELQKSTLA